MTCHLEDQLSAYMDDELTDEERRQVESHLENCESCQLLLEELLSVHSTVVHAFGEIQEPENLEIRVLQALSGTKERASAEKGWLLVPIAAFVSLVILWFAAGSIFAKVLHGFLKLMLAMVYMGSHLLSGVPVLSGLTVILSLGIITASVYSLRRLLQTSTS
ncbi:anti-sigma factor family protein [Paenibacillus sp. sgz5001063]|uniref:anti-sigma factor family protein n=1 Tax=Paenibacillus sp. sgz5001063 TaxID=3242474 RepID=UPI0036D2ACF7